LLGAKPWGVALTQ